MFGWTKRGPVRKDKLKTVGYENQFINHLLRGCAYLSESSRGLDEQDLSAGTVKNYFRICSAAHTFATIYLRLDSGGQTYTGMVQELGSFMVEHMQRNKPLKEKGKPFSNTKLAFDFLKTVIVHWCASIGSRSGQSAKHTKKVVKMALFLSMPYLSRQILYFESKKMPVSENALRWFGECCEELGECDDDMWKVFKVSDLVCGEPYSITNTLEVFDHGRPLPEVLDWHEAHMIRAAILQKYLDASQGKLNLEASKVKSVGLRMPDADARMQLNPPIGDDGPLETPAPKKSMNESILQSTAIASGKGMSDFSLVLEFGHALAI